MPRATLVLLFNDKNQILLGMKKRGFWAGKWNGFGWKPHGNETIKEAAIRELEEESGIDLEPGQIHELGLLHFFFEWKPEWNQDVYVFKGYYAGNFKETEEMLPQWFDVNKIPYDKMRDDDKFWIPNLINNQNFEMKFTFDENGKLLHKKPLK